MGGTTDVALHNIACGVLDGRTILHQLSSCCLKNHGSPSGGSFCSSSLWFLPTMSSSLAFLGIWLSSREVDWNLGLRSTLRPREKGRRELLVQIQRHEQRRCSRESPHSDWAPGVQAGYWFESLPDSLKRPFKFRGSFVVLVFWWKKGIWKDRIRKGEMSFFSVLALIWSLITWLPDVVNCVLIWIFWWFEECI